MANSMEDEAFRQLTPYFINLLKSGDRENRINAASVLKSSKEPAAVDALIEALYDPEEMVQSYAALSLGAIKDKRATDPLINLLKERSQPDIVRQSAAAALQTLDNTQAIEPILVILGDQTESETLKEDMARILGGFSDPDRVAKAIELATDPTHPMFVRLKIIEGWGNYSQPQTLELLIDFLNGGDPVLQQAAFRALRSFNDERAFKVVKQYRAKKHGRTDSGNELKPAIQSHSYAIYASYHQIYLGDAKTGEDNGFDQTWTWDEQSFNNALAVAPNLIAIWTASYGDVPVDVIVTDYDPGTADFDEWDQIAECSIEISSGKILIDGSMDYNPGSASIEIKPDIYQVRIYYGGLESEANNAPAEDDYYKIVLWPGESGETRIIKRFRQPDENGRGW